MPVETLRCARHGEATRLSCVQCSEPLCPKCAVRTEVGLKCEPCSAPVVAPRPPLVRRFRLATALAAVGLVAVAVAVALVFVGGGGGNKQAAAEQKPVGTWSSASGMTGIRGTAALVLLRDGTALASGGGVGAVPLATSARYDPKTGVWTPTGAMHQARRGHRAVVLSDGRVLVAGGIAGSELLASAEIYDPAKGSWTPTAPMSVPRLGFTLTVLTDGRVLAAGGTSVASAGGRPVASAEIYDPTKGTWTPTGSMTVARIDHTATRLPDGRVLVAGGVDSSGAPLVSAEIYDPAAGAFVHTTNMTEARSDQTATLLPSGSVLVAGGVGGAQADSSLQSAEVFDPSSEDWRAVKAMAVSRDLATATALADGRVLVAGGQSVNGGTRTALASAELFQPKDGSWRSAGTMTCPRSGQAAVRLGNGSVLVVAGDAAFPGKAPIAQGCAELYRP